MSVTKKFVLLLSGGIPFILIGHWMQISVGFFFLYNVAVLLAFSLDYSLTPKASALVLSRNTEDTLYIHTANQMEIQIQNQHKRPIQLEIKDEIPDFHFQCQQTQPLRLKVPAHSSASLHYEVIPTKRGNFTFGKIHVRYQGPLGLCTRRFRSSAEKEYKVYPNLLNIGKYRLIMQKNRLLEQGTKRVNIRGLGTEFESLREYVTGDDYRKVNWLATARENKLMINQFEIEKNQPVMILIDGGRPLSYEIRGFKMLDYAIDTALILSDIANQKGDLAGLMSFDTDVKMFISPQKGQTHRNRLMDALYRMEDSNMTSDYENAFYYFIQHQKRRSLIFLFTDFNTHDEAEDLLKQLSILSQKHVVIIMLMQNESLEKMAFQSSQNIRNIYNRSAAIETLKERQTIISTLRRRGVMCIESPVNNIAIDTINQYLLVKNRNIL